MVLLSQPPLSRPDGSICICLSFLRDCRTPVLRPIVATRSRMAYKSIPDPNYFEPAGHDMQIHVNMTCATPSRPHIYIYIYIYVTICIERGRKTHIYIYIERERERISIYTHLVLLQCLAQHSLGQRKPDTWSFSVASYLCHPPEARGGCNGHPTSTLESESVPCVWTP